MGRDLNVDYSLTIDAPSVPQYYAAYGLVDLRILQTLYAATYLAVLPDHNLHYDRDRKARIHERMGICPSPVHAVSGHKTDTQNNAKCCLLYTSPSPRDRTRSRMPSSA